MFVKDPQRAWTLGRVEGRNKNGVSLNVDGRRRDTRMSQVAEAGRALNASGDDLCDLDVFTEGSILHHVRRRFEADVIYTWCGSILIALNPFKKLPIYSDRIVDTFRADATDPHAYAVASRCYEALRDTGAPQSVLVSGESGAGKTETTKIILSYIARVAGGSRDNVAQRILESNPVLEAYGNAKTLRNDNSSRFGKWMTVAFDAHHRVAGCAVYTYLLEKSRVVGCGSGERTYHALYQVLSGDFGLGEAETFPYLARGGCLTIDRVDDAEEFMSQKRALDTLGIDPQDVLSLVAAVLYLGRAKFEGNDARCVNGAASLDRCTPLLGLDAAEVHAALTTRTERMGRGSIIMIRLTPKQAAAARDALAKALYGGLFDYLVKRVNESLHSDAAQTGSIGVLDIFGFEVFRYNSFEQLCINYANERLQLFFDACVFGEELRTYEREGVPFAHVQFEDNAKCVALFDGRPVNLFSLLDDECQGGEGARDDRYGSKCATTFARKNVHFEARGLDGAQFAVRHFAGAVVYETQGFVAKNRDKLSTTLQALGATGNRLVASFFADDKRTKTLGSSFRRQLSNLTRVLEKTQPSFIRCIKSNNVKEPDTFDAPLCLEQLRYSGLFEAIRIRRAGYAHRETHSSFARRYAVLIGNVNFGSPKATCERVLASPRVKTLFNEPFAVCLGQTKVFIKDGRARNALERLRAQLLGRYAKILQAAWRSFKARFGAARRRRRSAIDRAKRARVARNAAAILNRWARGASCRRALRGDRKRISALKAAFGRDTGRPVDVAALRDLETALLPWRRRLPYQRVIKDLVETAAGRCAALRRNGAALDAVETAHSQRDAKALKSSLRIANDLGLSSLPPIRAAVDDLDRIHRDKKIAQDLAAFVADPLRVGDGDILALLDASEALGLGGVQEARAAYANVESALKAKRRLRAACEAVDEEAASHALTDIPPGSRWPEVAAAAELRRMAAFERLLCDESGPVLTPALVELCMRVEYDIDTVAAEAALADAAGDLLPRVIRAYKWRRCSCTWLPTPDGEFYGLDVASARRRGCDRPVSPRALSPRVDDAPSPPPAPFSGTAGRQRAPRATDAPPPPPSPLVRTARHGPPRAHTTGGDRLATSQARLKASRETLAATNRKYDSARKRAVARPGAFR